jgi:hypothetical protein
MLTGRDGTMRTINEAGRDILIYSFGLTLAPISSRHCSAPRSAASTAAWKGARGRITRSSNGEELGDLCIKSERSCSRSAAVGFSRPRSSRLT